MKTTPSSCTLCTVLAAVVASWAVPCAARADFPPLALEPVAVGQFGSPVAVTHAADGSGRLFIGDQRGTIHILQDGVVLPQPFLDLSAKLVTERPGFDERGLLGLAFHPEFANPEAPGGGRFYVYYSGPSPDAPGTAAEPVDHRSVISEFRISADDADLADPASERVLLTFNQPQFNHNGGQLAFGPADGLLYISTGDGGSSNDNNAGHTGGDPSQPSGVLGNSQDLTNLLGKLLRIDPLPDSGTGYAIPPDNPFIGQGGVREEIFAYGLRNPWRFSFDAAAEGGPRLFLADVGQARFEEINLIEAGGNYGWRRFEGHADFDDTTPAAGPFEAPVAVYAHPGTAGDTGLAEVGLSVTGGYVYRGSAIPDLGGKYIFGDWSTGFGSPDGTLLGLEETSPGSFEMSVLEIAGGNPIGRYIPAFGIDEAGEIYVATKTSLAPSAPDPDSGLPAGQLFRLVAAPEPVELPLPATRDNSIYSDLPNNSNGTGDLFAGRIQNAGGLRRALVRFNLDDIPPGAELLDASLGLTVNLTVTGSFDFSLHRLTRDWGEAGSSGTGQGGPAQPGDATWTATFSGSGNWDTPGGDFVATASATTAVGGNGTYAWSSAALADDVRQWLADPTTNHGWILRGDETTPSAKRFGSRESGSPNDRPRLVVTYLPGETLTRRQIWEREHYPIGRFIAPDEDLDEDGIGALLEYAWNFDPFVADDSALGLEVELDLAAENASITFRRDPRAVDLTYTLEASEDLEEWLPLVVSAAGAPPTGGAFTAEAAAPDDAELRLVAAEVELERTTHPRRFLRLRVSR